MIWIPMILLALACFAIAAFVLKMPRSAYSLFGAALLFGLAGYAAQGNPGQPGSPTARVDATSGIGSALIESRRALFDPAQPPSYYVTLSDGFARRGQFDDAAGLLLGATDADPDDTEAWVAMGNALVEHADGVPTPAAFEAFDRARATDPDHPAAPYFQGVAMLRAERPDEARALWADMVENAPEDAEWLPVMRQRLEQLDLLISVSEARR